MSVEARAGPARLERSVFRPVRMDCAAEEAMVRAKLEGLAPVRALAFELAAREVAVFHDGFARRQPRHAGARLRITASAWSPCMAPSGPRSASPA